MAISPTMDQRTARDAARVRGRASAGAAVLSVVLGLLAGVFAATAPDEARTLLVGGCVLALVGALGCVFVAVANRALAMAPDERGPRVIAGAVLGGVLVAWLVTAVVVACGPAVARVAGRRARPRGGRAAGGWPWPP